MQATLVFCLRELMSKLVVLAVVAHRFDLTFLMNIAFIVSK